MLRLLIQHLAFLVDGGQQGGLDGPVQVHHVEAQQGSQLVFGIQGEQRGVAALDGKVDVARAAMRAAGARAIQHHFAHAVALCQLGDFVAQGRRQGLCSVRLGGGYVCFAYLQCSVYRFFT